MVRINARTERLRKSGEFETSVAFLANEGPKFDTVVVLLLKRVIALAIVFLSFTATPYLTLLMRLTL